MCSYTASSRSSTTRRCWPSRSAWSPRGSEPGLAENRHDDRALAADVRRGVPRVFGGEPSLLGRVRVAGLRMGAQPVAEDDVPQVLVAVGPEHVQVHVVGGGPQATVLV